MQQTYASRERVLFVCAVTVRHGVLCCILQLCVEVLHEHLIHGMDRIVVQIVAVTAVTLINAAKCNIKQSKHSMIQA
jgi:hypothetical protein